MTSTELKDLVKAHFNLVEADVIEETNETFGELKDENGAFTLRFPGDSLQIGDKVTVVTAEGQEMDAPDGEHRLEDGTRIVTKDSVVTTEGQEMEAPDGEHELEDGTKIVTKDSVVEEIMSADGEKAMAQEAMAEHDEEEMEETKEEEVMEEEEEAKMEEAKVEDIIEAIISEVKDEMAKMEEKMAALEDKVSKMEAMPAAEPTITSTGKKMEAKRGFSAFDINNSRNADRIKMAIEQIKNRKN